MCTNSFISNKSGINKIISSESGINNNTSNFTTTRANTENNNILYYNEPMLPKKTVKKKVKNFTVKDECCGCDHSITPEYCGCDDTITPAESDNQRRLKVIKGDVNKLSDRRTLRHENNPEKRKSSSRPCSFVASSSRGDLNDLEIIKDDKAKCCNDNADDIRAAGAIDKFESPKISRLDPNAALETVRVCDTTEEEVRICDNTEEEVIICNNTEEEVRICDNTEDKRVAAGQLEFDSPKISRLNPTESIETVRRLLKDSEEIKVDQRFIVSYQCTIDLDEKENENIDLDEKENENICENGMKVLSKCVEGSPNDHADTSCSVLLSISTMGVKLTNTFGNNIVTYPLDTVLCNFTCAEDGRYFGLVTRNTLTKCSADSSSPPTTSSHLISSVLYSCVVFMVDPNLANHNIHRETASLFGVSCKKVIGGCQQFPFSPTVVLTELNSFYKNRNCINCYSTSSFMMSSDTPSGTLERLRGNSIEKSRLVDHRRCENNFVSYPFTPDKRIISNTLERIRGNAAYSSSSTRDPKKLMISPPTSLVRLNEEEKKELLNEIEKKKIKRSQSDDDESPPPQGFFRMNNNNVFRRKSTTEVELFGTINSCQTKSQVIVSGTNSIGSDYRKPPVPQKMYPLPKYSCDIPSTTIFNGLKRTGRRKSEAPSFSPKTSLKELFFRTNVKKASTPPSTARFYLNHDVNENTRQLRVLSLTSSEQSLDGKTTSSVDAWAQSLDKLLADAAGLKCFQEFLKKEFSEENLLFWVACERFKKVTDLTPMTNTAKKIFSNYLSADAPFLVNVDSVAVKMTESELNTPHTLMFDIPQQQVFQLMKFDSYNRFLKSSLYQDYVSAEKSGRKLYQVEKDGKFQKNQLWTKSMRSPPSGDKRRNPLNFLNRGKNTTSPDHEKVRKERSSSLGAYDECNRKNIVNPSEINGYVPKDQLWNGVHSKSRIVRVILPDGTSGFVVGDAGKTLRDGLKELGEQKGLQLQSIDVTVGHDKKVANLDSDISTLQENIINLERRVLLRFDLPNGRSVGVKTDPSKTLRDVLEPVMKANGFEMDNYSIVIINTKIPLSLDLCASAMENKRLVTRLNPKKLEKQNSDSAVSLMRSQGFHASFRKYRTNSKIVAEGKDGKLESRKLTHKKSDDGAAALMLVLQKCQKSRLDDQRGLISRDIEIPDFLKVSSSTPSPIRNKSVDMGNCNSLQNDPLSVAHQFPGSPFFIDKSFKDLTDKLDLSLSAPQHTRAHSRLRFARDWRQLPSLQSIDSACSLNRMHTKADGSNTLPRPTDTKVRLLGLSKSESSLLTRDNLINISRSSTEACGSSGNSLKCIWSKDERDTSSNDNTDDDVFPCRSGTFSYGDNYIGEHDNTGFVTFNNPSNDVNNRPRPLPITKFNESDILRGLNEDENENKDEDEDDNLEKKNCKLRIQTTELRQDSGIGTNPSNSENNININSESNEGFTKIKPMEFRSMLDVPMTQSRERIGSIDIMDYNLSPRAQGRFRKFSLCDDIRMNSVHREHFSFEGNAVPTPEKGKLLKGETVRGRQNEKITFV